jgi:hypothetical protein
MGAGAASSGSGTLEVDASPEVYALPVGNSLIRRRAGR